MTEARETALFWADLHVHSARSLATSRDCTPEGLHRWAQLKGVTVAGTGDATHPDWLAELARKLEPAAPGLYRLRAEFAAPVDAAVPPACRAPVFFAVTAEVSSVFRQDGRTRKVHSLLLFPSLESAAAFSRRLEAHAKVRSDGRPVTRLLPRDLLETALACSSDSLLIPAHIWTPWFSLFGARSGFDSLEECFGDLAPEITAIETGLSSDPPMNNRWSALDRLALVSHSDLHSPAMLGRKATRFRGPPDFFRMRRGLRDRSSGICAGTLELFPETGKYHWDGHRACGIALAPDAARKQGGLCPVCGRPLTPGVLHRIEDLADRPAGVPPPSGRPPFAYWVPLPELLAECLGCAAAARRVQQACQTLREQFGPEIPLVLDADAAALAAALGPAGERLGEAVANLRAGRVLRQPGADGVYGRALLLS